MTTIKQNVDPHLRYQEKSCANCRYFRMHQTGASTSECLLIGRTLGIVGIYEYNQLIEWGRERLCDFWSRRPKSWKIMCDKNPHFYDQYITRETNIKRRKRLRLKPL